MKRYIISLLILTSSNIVFAETFTTANVIHTTCIQLHSNLSSSSRDTATSHDVVTLQAFLKKNGYLKTNLTGIFGQETKNAVIAFQNKNNIHPKNPGTVGDETRKKIQSLSCSTIVASTKKIPQSTSTSIKKEPFMLSPTFPVERNKEVTPIQGTNKNITVVSPNGGETVHIDTSNTAKGSDIFTVRWTPQNVTGTTNIYLVDTKEQRCLLGFSPTESGIFTLKLATSYTCKFSKKILTSGQYKVRIFTDTRISTSSQFGINDLSDDYFTLSLP